MITAKNIKCEYKNGDKIQVLFEDASFTINDGDFAIITGASGSGKSSLLKILSGTMKPTSGKVYWDDTELYSLKEAELNNMRITESSFVYQDFMLINELKAYDNILLVQHLSKKIDNQLVQSIINDLAIQGLMDKYPKVLSGGEKQKVAIARALANNPKVLFCDEPTGSLDYKSTVQIMDILYKLNKEQGITIILVTHEQENLKYGNKFIRFENGELKCV